MRSISIKSFNRNSAPDNDGLVTVTYKIPTEELFGARSYVHVVLVVWDGRANHVYFTLAAPLILHRSGSFDVASGAMKIDSSSSDRRSEDTTALAQPRTRHSDLVARYGTEQAIAIENGRVLVGMTKDAVIAARGQPDNKEVIPPDDEMWVYGSERISISKGKVTHVGH